MYIYVCIYIYVYIYMYIYIYVLVRMCIYIYIYRHMYLQAYVYMYICIYTYMCTCIICISVLTGLVAGLFFGGKCVHFNLRPRRHCLHAEHAASAIFAEFVICFDLCMSMRSTAPSDDEPRAPRFVHSVLYSHWPDIVYAGHAI